MLDDFSTTYAEARAKFLGVAQARGAQIVSATHPAVRGVQGEELAMDFAVFGDPNAEKTLLLVSGTHGQEGYTGSALQIAFLRDVALPEDVNIVALHALNPWGFSHLSRTDDANIDLNRNFRDFATPPPKNEVYAEIHGALCPDAWSADTSNWSALQERLLKTHGRQRFLSGFTGGQFDEPTGMNFGGRAPTWSNTAVAQHLPPLLANAKKVAFIEWHTGLGRFGELCHICMFDPASSAYARVFDWMGEDARTTFEAAFDGSKGATPSYTGLFCTWLPKAAPHAEWAGLVIEVGTYDNAIVADALRMDRWLKFGRTSSTPRAEIQRAMIEGLYPSSLAWREAAMANGGDAHQRALAGLGRW